MNNSTNMEELVRQVNTLDILYKIVPVERLAEIKNDIAEIEKKEALNQFQKYIFRQGYILDADKANFTA